MHASGGGKGHDPPAAAQRHRQKLWRAHAACMRACMRCVRVRAGAGRGAHSYLHRQTDDGGCSMARLLPLVVETDAPPAGPTTEATNHARSSTQRVWCRVQCDWEGCGGVRELKIGARQALAARRFFAFLHLLEAQGTRAAGQPLLGVKSMTAVYFSYTQPDPTPKRPNLQSDGCDKDWVARNARPTHRSHHISSYKRPAAQHPPFCFIYNAPSQTNSPNSSQPRPTPNRSNTHTSNVKTPHSRYLEANQIPASRDQPHTDQHTHLER